MADTETRINIPVTKKLRDAVNSMADQLGIRQRKLVPMLLTEALKARREAKQTVNGTGE